MAPIAVGDHITELLYLYFIYTIHFILMSDISDKCLSVSWILDLEIILSFIRKQMLCFIRID